MPYSGVFGESMVERVIEKSRFLTYTAAVDGEEELKAFLNRTRAAHPLATHVCYASVADGVGNLQRFSDDGEPQGTAGMPILGVIKARSLFCTAVAVVRYFGGIKLGAGGLTRAYAGCAAAGLDGAEMREYELCAEIAVTVDYPDVNALIRFLNGRNVLRKEFGERAVFVVAVRESEVLSFERACTEALCGRAEQAEIRRYLFPFPRMQRP